MNNNIIDFIQKNKNPIINQSINILYNNFNNYQNNLNNNNQIQNEGNDINNNISKLNTSEYFFERYGKLGWLCQDCNNFNFSSRTKCNKCGIKMKPIKINNIQNNINIPNDKKEKKSFVKKSGDWMCPNCSNINFSFRIKCNRCKVSKQQAFLISQQKKMMNNINQMKLVNNNNMNNNLNNENFINMNNNQTINQQINQLLLNNSLNNQSNAYQNNNNNNINQIQRLLYLMQTNHN